MSEGSPEKSLMARLKKVAEPEQEGVRTIGEEQVVVLKRGKKPHVKKMTSGFSGETSPPSSDAKPMRNREPDYPHLRDRPDPEDLAAFKKRKRLDKARAEPAKKEPRVEETESVPTMPRDANWEGLTSSLTPGEEEMRADIAKKHGPPAEPPSNAFKGGNWVGYNEKLAKEVRPPPPPQIDHPFGRTTDDEGKLLQEPTLVSAVRAGFERIKRGLQKMSGTVRDTARTTREESERGAREIAGKMERERIQEVRSALQSLIDAANEGQQRITAEAQKNRIPRFWQKETFKDVYILVGSTFFTFYMFSEKIAQKMHQLIGVKTHAFYQTLSLGMATAALAGMFVGKITHNYTTRTGKKHPLLSSVILGSIAATAAGIAAMEAYARAEYNVSFIGHVLGLPSGTPQVPRLPPMPEIPDIEFVPDQIPTPKPPTPETPPPVASPPAETPPAAVEPPLPPSAPVAQVFAPIPLEAGNPILTRGLTAFVEKYFFGANGALRDLGLSAAAQNQIVMALNETLTSSLQRDFFMNPKQVYEVAGSIAFTLNDVINTPLLGNERFLQAFAAELRDPITMQWNPDYDTLMRELDTRGGIEAVQTLLRTRFGG